jgi:hypothetical protein
MDRALTFVHVMFLPCALGDEGNLSARMMKAIRKVIVFILAIAMMVVGLYVLAQLFIWGHGLFGRSVPIGSFLIGIGIYVLWADFIEPILGRWKSQK